MALHHSYCGGVEVSVPVPSIVNSIAFNDTAASPAHALGFSASVGNRLVAFAAIASSGDPVLNSITQSNVTWVRVPSSFEAGISSSACEMWISDEITTTAGATATFNYSTTNTNTAIVIEVNSISSDPHSAVSTSGTSSGETSLVGINTEANDNIVRALTLNFFLQRGDYGQTLTPDGGFTLIVRRGTGDTKANDQTVALYEHFNDTRGTLSTTVTSSDSDRWATICLTLNGVGGPHGYR